MSKTNRPAFAGPQQQSARAPGAPPRPKFWALSHGRVLLLGAALMLVMLALLGMAVQSNFARLQEANRWNIHTYRVLERIDIVSTLLDAQEAQLRGFALMGDADYLRQLKKSNGVGVRALNELRFLTRDRGEQQRRLASIEPEYLAYKEQFVLPWMRAPRSRAEAARIQRVLREQTRARGARSRGLQASLQQMEDTERRLLAERAHELKIAQSETMRTLLGGSAFVILLAIALTMLLGRAVRAQQEAGARMAHLNESLVAEVAERRTAEESLRASEAGFRHLAEDSLDLICRHAPDGTLTYVSPAAWPLLGYKPAEMVGLHPSHFRSKKEVANETLSFAEQFSAQLRDSHHKPVLRAYRHAKGHKIWLEVVGHAIVDSESGEVRAWHTAARDVSARVREEKARARLLAGLRAIVEIADELIGAPSEEELLKNAVEMMVARVGLKRCSIYLSLPGDREDEFSALMRGTFGTDENGVAVAENELLYNTCNDPSPDDITPAPGERWIVRGEQIRYVWREGERVELPGRGWLARTPIATRNNILGLFFHDSSPDETPHDAVEQQLIAVFCSLLGALLERGRSQTRMTHQQRLLESLMENAPLFLYSVDADEKFTLATGNVLPAIGFSPTEILGQAASEIMPQDSVSIEGMRRALQGETMQQELEFAGRWLKMWRQPIRDESGEINGMIGIGMDITQQHRAQIALQNSEARYRQVADSLQDVLFQTDANGCWTFLNPAWAEITGTPVAQALSTPCADALYPDDRAEFAQLLDVARAVQMGNGTANGTANAAADVAPRVLRFVTGSGEVRWLEVALRANFGEDGDFRGTAGTLRDVTEKLRAEAALRETLEMKRAILQGASYAIISTDENGIIQTFNPAAERLIGVSAAEVVGKRTPEFFHDPAELRARAEQFRQEFGEAPKNAFEVLTMRGKQHGNHESEWNCLRSDGTTFPMRVSHSVLAGPDGSVAGHVAIGYDLTEARRAEKLKNEFVSVVSHELRTPLTSIRGALGLLSGGVAGALPASAAQMIGIAQKNADRLVLLINDILDIEKIESGQMRFETGEVALPSLLETALESNRGYAQTLGVEIELEPLPPELCAATLLGDEARLQQVLSNLLSNACKWTPKGSHVRLRALVDADPSSDSTAESAAESRIAIEVQDAGPGVPPEFESRLFERFAQADGSATREKGGTGLGLAVSQAIVEKHGGTIGYRAPDAAVGRAGATFRFELPAHNVAAPEPAIEAVERILVVEDDEETAALLRAILENAGYAVEVAHSRAAALSVARAGAKLTGITLDLHLPDGHGLDLMEELRALPATRAVPMLVISSFCDERAQRSPEIHHWLEKPVNSEQLLCALASKQPRSAGENSDGKARVLHVEDDDDIRRVVAMILTDSSQVTMAATLAQARALLQEQTFDLALLDIGLPDGNGLDLIADLEAREPPIPALIFSAREQESEDALHVAAALIKSRTPNEALRAKVEELLAAKVATPA